MNLRKTISALVFVLVFLFAGSAATWAEEAARYEYKLVPLGSLTALQKKAESEARMDEVGKILNREGREGWEMVSIFAVRTTFDPNVFFAAMKRPLSESGPMR
ncbi:MAG: DUF4177 domain-containing protein [Synergistaceae bacterium]|nr:DUF4177 domain-containing protein [Synergistaceae bacterium]